MTQSPEDIFQQIEDLLSAGKADLARQALAKQLKLNPGSTRAWWLMSQALTDRGQQVDCLQRLLRLDPGDERAKQRLAELNKLQEVLPSISPFSTSVAQMEMKSADESPALPAWAARSEASIQTPAEEMEEEISTPVGEPQASRRKPTPPRLKRLLAGGLVLMALLAILIIFGLLILSNRRRLAESQLRIEQETLTMAQALTNMPLPTLIPTWTASPSRTLQPSSTSTTIPTHTPTLRYPPTNTPRPADLVGPGVGLFAPDFSLPDPAAGENVALSQFEGRPIYLAFLSSLCADCQNEAESIETIARTYQDTGLVVLAIDPVDDAAALESFRSSLQISFPILLDAQGTTQADYHVTSLPRHFFINSGGRISYIWKGKMTLAAMNTQVAVILRWYSTPTP